VGLDDWTTVGQEDCETVSLSGVNEAETTPDRTPVSNGFRYGTTTM
jgi:hypothetical protein